MKKKEEPVKTTAIVAAQPMTPAEKAAADKLWEARVEEFRRRGQQCASVSLEYFYDLGGFAADVFENSRKYGNRTSDNLAKSLNTSQAKLLRMVQFNKQWTEKQKQIAVGRGLSFTDVRILIPVNDLAARNALEEKLGKGELTEVQAEEEVRKLVKNITAKQKEAGVETDGRKNPKPKAVFNAFNILLELFVGRLGAFSAAYDEYEEVDDPDRLKELNEQLKVTRSRLDKVVKEILAVQKKITK